MTYTCYNRECTREVPEEYTFCEEHKREYWHEDKKDAQYWKRRFEKRANGMIATPTPKPLPTENPYGHLSFEELKSLDKKAVDWLRINRSSNSYPAAFRKYQLLIKTLNARTPGF